MGDPRLYELLNSDNCLLTFIDCEPQPIFGVQSIDRQQLINNLVGLAKTARLFNIPTIITTLGERMYSGPVVPEIHDQFPDYQPIDRTVINAWEDSEFHDAVEHTDRKKIIIAGTWTESSIAFTGISAISAGYDVYVVTDCCGGTSHIAQRAGLERLSQAGAISSTWFQILLEFQNDWSRMETGVGVCDIMKEHAGAIGQGVLYAKAVMPEHAM